MNELAIFAGAGGGILGGNLLGWRTVCAVELDAFAASVLAQRQNDGLLPAFPIWSDVATFDGHAWRGIVDVVSGGFPCQDISSAGRGEGIDGAQSGLWVEMARIIREVRPPYAFVENSPMLTSRGLGRVLGDLAEMGFDARWGVLGAHNVGAPHERDRIWIVAHSEANGCGSRRTWRPVAGCQGELEPALQELAYADSEPQERPAIARSERNPWLPEPDVGRVANGVADRVDRLKAIGNGQVPRVAATAWRILIDAARKGTR